MYTAWLKGGCRFCLPGSQNKISLCHFGEVLKENKDEPIELNVNVSDLDSQSYHKGGATFCAHGCTVALPITFIFLLTVWLIGNLNI